MCLDRPYVFFVVVICNRWLLFTAFISSKAVRDETESDSIRRIITRHQIEFNHNGQLLYGCNCFDLDNFFRSIQSFGNSLVRITITPQPPPKTNVIYICGFHIVFGVVFFLNMLFFSVCLIEVIYFIWFWISSNGHARKQDLCERFPQKTISTEKMVN